MAKLDNPAGRLYEILAAYKRSAANTRNVVDHWVAVFEVEDRGEALLRVAETAGLIPQVEAALTRVGDPDQMTLFRTFADDLIHAVIHPRADTYSMQSQAVVVGDESLAVLGGVSAFLSATASEGPVPSGEEVASLYQQVMSLIDEIITDGTLTEDIKRLALDHAYRLAQALDHFRIGGPGAVREATERLIGSVAMAPPPVQQSTVWRRMWDVFGKAWTIFNRAPQAQQALEAMPEIFKALPM